MSTSVYVDEIYALSDPDTGEICYIGKARDSRKRLVTHVRDIRKGKTTPLHCWIRSLFAAGKRPTSTVLLVTSDWRVSERQMIAQYREDGYRLLNLAEGGNAPYCSREQRSANGKATASAIHSSPARRRVWELKRTLGSALKRGELPEAVKAKMRMAAQKAPHLFGLWGGI